MNRPAQIPELLVKREEAKRSDRLIQAGALLGALVLLVLSGFALRPINQARSEGQYVLQSEDTKGLPPDLQLLMHTGTLRAIAIDYAFIRAESMKQEGKYYDAMQLAELLCKMAPRFAEVWAFNSWNQAYNISVTQYTPEGRWKWIQNGIKILRDKGIQYNPTAIKLYRDLAYTYYFKIGGTMDDEHRSYKRMLAFEIEQIMGAATLYESTEEAIASFKAIVDAPHDVERLVQEDEDVKRLVNELATVDLKPDKVLLAFVARYLRPGMIDSELIEDRLSEEDPVKRKLLDQMAVLEEPTNRAARDRLLAAIRSKALREDQKLDLDFMLMLMEKYGPLDLRSPFSHAIFWDSMGHVQTADNLVTSDADEMNAARNILHSLHDLSIRGQIIFEPNYDDPFKSAYDTLPDLRFIPPTHKAYLELGEQQFGDQEGFREGTAGENFFSGHVNFLLGSIQSLFLEGGTEHLRLAEELRDYLREYDRDPMGQIKPQYLLPVRALALNDLKDRLDSQRHASDRIGRLVRRALRALANGRKDLHDQFVENAKQALNYYNEPTKTDRNDRRKLPVMEEYYPAVVMRFMSESNQTMPVVYKAELWRVLDPSIKRQVYDTILPVVTKICETSIPKYDVAKVMPEPPGMDEWRRTQAEKPKDPNERENKVNLGFSNK